MTLEEVLKVVKNKKIKKELELPVQGKTRYKIILNSENKLILGYIFNNKLYCIVIYDCLGNKVYSNEISNVELNIINKYLGFIEAKDALKEVMCFSEACEKWNISESALRMRLSRGTLKENEEYRKSGKKVNLITRTAMKKYYKDQE